MGLFSGLVGGVLGLGSTLLGNKSAKQEAQANRDWQEEMSNTSIQRRVEDLRKAGLNPLLAVQNASGGATTPNGAVADIKRVDPAFITAVSSAFLASKQAKVAEAEARKIDAETENISNDNSIFDIKKKKAELENFLLSSNILNNKVLMEWTRARTEREKMEIIYTQARKMKVDLDMVHISKINQLLEYDLKDETNTPFGRRREMQWDRLKDVVDWFVPWAEGSKRQNKSIVINNIRD